MKSLDLYQASHLARSIVKESGDQLNLEWKVAKETTQKDLRDIATNYDHLVEKRISKALEQLFPTHSIFGEEVTKTNQTSDYAWYIDPIDGTKYFAGDIPLFSVSLGLYHQDKSVLGVVYNPISNQMYSGYHNGPALLNYGQIQVANNRPLKETIVYGDLSKFEQFSIEKQQTIQAKYFSVSSAVYRVRAFGCGSLALCWIASGGLDAFIDFTGKTKIFDVAAGLAILEAAGGVYEYLPQGKNQLLLAANSKKTLNALKKLIA